MATLFAEELTAPELAGFVTDRTVGILPVAAIEPHGPHLPLSTDCDIARGHLTRLPQVLQDEFEVLVLPLQTIGLSVEHQGLPGAFSHTAEQLLAVWGNVAATFRAAGGQRLIVISSHGGNSELVGLLTQRLRAERGMLAVAASWARFGQPEGVFEDDELAYGIHGGAVETSLMLHYFPETVRGELIADFGSAAHDWDEGATRLSAHGRIRAAWMTRDLNPLGALGAATAATAEKGAASAAHALGAFAELIEDVAHFDLARLTPAGNGR